MIPPFTEQAAALRRKVLGGTLPTSHASAGDDQILVFDDFLTDPVTYRAWVLTQPFSSVPLGPVTFHGIAECPDARVLQAIAERCPHVTPTVTFFRRSPEGQVEPNFIHTDRDMGDWTGILYLTPDPPAGDGTTFWWHRQTHATASVATVEADMHAEWRTWRDRDQWEPWHMVHAKFNRLLLFSAPLFHSRAIERNYGVGEDARLVQLVFGTGSLRT